METWLYSIIVCIICGEIFITWFVQSWVSCNSFVCLHTQKSVFFRQEKQQKKTHKEIFHQSIFHKWKVTSIHQRRNRKFPVFINYLKLKSSKLLIVCARKHMFSIAHTHIQKPHLHITCFRFANASCSLSIFFFRSFFLSSLDIRFLRIYIHVAFGKSYVF